MNFVVQVKRTGTMTDPEILKLIALRVSGEETPEGKRKLDIWLAQSGRNRQLYSETQRLWMQGTTSDSIRERLNRRYIAQGLIQETIGNLVGFVVGLWVSNTFTHYVRERKSVKNLYGLLGRKKYVVHTIPEWMQFCLSVLIGFVVLELIHYFFLSGKFLKIITYFKNRLNNNSNTV